MSDNFLGPKPVRSVAAFLWMPQFSRSFRNFSFLMPVFVQVLSSVFISAGLLPKNHPSQFYGQEGVPKYGVGRIIGEAWYNMRRNRAGFSQWGVFAGVMLMIAMIIGSMVTFMMTVAFGVGTTAQAQLFSHPDGDSSFGSGTHGYNTDHSTDPFDRLIPPPGSPAGDYGIMMLDKAIRAGAYGQGGALQNATQKLMLIYNSGILVIASVIIMWMIISIVVDTAKTGQVGGGRHNMVWTPIRVVFALVLLVPLGSTGYSSGQFMVMKLAEWGSNFGTRAWSAYARNVAENTSFIVAGGQMDYAGEAVFSFTKMWLCRISANANLSDSGSGSIDDYIVEKKVTRREPDSGDRAAVVRGYPIDETIYFERTGTRGMRGSITYPAEGRRPIDESRKPIDKAILRLKEEMALAYARHLKAIEPQVITLACDFARSQNEFSGEILMSEAQGNLGTKYGDVVNQKYMGDWSGCASAVGDPNVRPKENERARLQTIIDRYQGLIKNDYTQAMQRFSSTQDDLANEMTERGWAGMGVFYHRIGQLNAAVYDAKKATNVITTGSLEDMEVKEDSWYNFGPFKNDTEWLKRTQGTLQAFHSWWTAVPDGGDITNATEGRSNKSISLTEMKQDAAGAVTKQMGFGESNGLIRLLADDGPENLSKSPLAIIASIGDILFWTPVVSFISLIAIQAFAGGAFGWVTGGGAPMVIAQIINFLMSMMLPLMFAGLLLKFYLPLIPFIRVVMSVLTWIISVFEAVAMVPIAALAHLSSQGEGLAAGAAESAWKLWLNILLRPILTVIGFVGAMLVFNAFASYVNGAFADMWKNSDNGGMNAVVDWFVFAILYTFIMYTVANTVFKMLDLVPDALGKWYNVPKDQSFDGINEAAIIGGQLMNKVAAPQLKGKGGDEGGGGGGGKGPGANTTQPPKQPGPPGLA